MHILLSGRMQILVAPEEGGQARSIGVRKSGDVLGEIALFTGCERSATVVAIRDSTLGYLSREDFDFVMETYPHTKPDVANFIIDRLIKTQGATYNHLDKKAIIAVLPIDEALGAGTFTSGLRNSMQRLGDTVLVDAQSINDVCSGCFDADGHEVASRIERYLESLEQTNDYLILEASASLNNWTRTCLSFAETVVFVTSTSASLERATRLARQFQDSHNKSGHKSELVLVQDNTVAAPKGTMPWLEAIRADRHHHLRLASVEDFDRLARSITGNSVSLILSGGGARGFAHLGVIRALRKIGIPIDCVGGASQGAIIAAGVAMGWDDARMIAEYKTAYVDVNPGNDYTLPVFSIIKGKKMSQGLRRHFGETLIEDLWLPFFAISSNLSTGQEKVHRTGLLWHSLRASASLPAILPPVFDNSEVLVDGSILNNLPVKIAKDLMQGHVIVIDTSPDDDFFYEEAELPAAWKYIVQRIFSLGKRSDLPTIERLVMKSAMLGSRKESEAAARLADLHLTPSVKEFKLWDWHRMLEISEAGYEQCHDRLAEWSAMHPELLWRTERH